MTALARWRRVDGVLLLDKPSGISSNGALQGVRRLYRAERAGHTGTLDPMAEGLLPVCFGEATKFSAELLDGDKTYFARVRFGVRTATGDAEGEVIERREVAVSRDRLLEALMRFQGDIEQRPPMYSALKYQGRPLYEYARKGEEVARALRTVHIGSIELHEFVDGEAQVAITCSKGTYVRVLAEDLGEALGCGAHLSGLIRTRVGPFGLEQAHTPDGLAALDEPGRNALLLPVDVLLQGYPQITLGEIPAVRFYLGEAVQCAIGDQGKTRVYGSDGSFLGLGIAELPATIKPKRLIRR